MGSIPNTTERTERKEEKEVWGKRGGREKRREGRAKRGKKRNVGQRRQTLPAAGTGDTLQILQALNGPQEISWMCLRQYIRRLRLNGHNSRKTQIIKGDLKSSIYIEFSCIYYGTKMHNLKPSYKLHVPHDKCSKH